MWQLLEFLDANQPWRERTSSTNDRGRTIFRAPDVMRDDGRLKEVPGVAMYRRPCRVLVEFKGERADLAAGRDTKVFSLVVVFTQPPLSFQKSRGIKSGSMSTVA